MEKNLVRTLEHGGLEYSFSLCRKEKVQLGPVEVDQWWMTVPPLYAQRQYRSSSAGLESGSIIAKRLSAPTEGGNRLEILRLYWGAVTAWNATANPEAQERLLLSSLVPKVRAAGSRRILADAFLSRMTMSKSNELIRDLDHMLRTSRDSHMTPDEFHDQTKNLLGRHEFSSETQTAYRALSRELLDEPRQLLLSGDLVGGLACVDRNWNILMRRVGRRAGHADAKTALDVISYEARAAFHHCYSVTWFSLIYALKREPGFTLMSAAFLEFWHTAKIDEPRRPLFHSHVFALHPALGAFMRTATGPQLLGEWLQDRESVDKHGRLLHAVYVTLMDYSLRRDDARRDRPKSSERGVSDLTAVEEHQEERQRGRRRH